MCAQSRPKEWEVTQNWKCKEALYIYEVEGSYDKTI